MQVVHTVSELRAALANAQAPSFVPTMGNLHDGHLDLVRTAKPLGDFTVASIFVNRLQFAPHEDFDTYPRTLEADCERLAVAGCDLVFAPAEAELYPEPQGYRVHPPAHLADILEGQFRPGFFTGVCTVVLKLFNLVLAQGSGPRHAVFGQKDYQQLMVVRHLVRQMALPIAVVGVPTRRAADGLALSSRNGYLSPTERQEAVALHQSLQALATKAIGHLQSPQANAQGLAALEVEAVDALNGRGWKTDYLTVRRRADLQPPVAGSDGAGDLVVLGASRLGSTRLIDNLEA